MFDKLQQACEAAKAQKEAHKQEKKLLFAKHKEMQQQLAEAVCLFSR